MPKGGNNGFNLHEHDGWYKAKGGREGNAGGEMMVSGGGGGGGGLGKAARPAFKVRHSLRYLLSCAVVQ